MSEDKFGDENPQSSGFMISANMIDLEQLKEHFVPAEAHVEQARRIDELNVSVVRLRRVLYTALALGSAYGLFDVLTWLLSK
jgi:uncharacterized membrane protein (DUF2068 family)